MRRSYMALALASASLAACAGSPPLLGDDSALVVKRVDSLPIPSATDGNADARPYLIGPFDKLEINVFGIEELSKREVQADASGNIAFPLAGTINSSGLTPNALAVQVATRLRQAHIRDPQVTVNLRETVSRVVTVDGEVREPGLYPVIGKMTLMRTVATAKGLAEFAQSRYIVVFRTVSGTRYATLYNLDAIRGGYYADPEIFADDVVVVSDNRARRLFRDVMQVAPAIITPLTYILVR